MTGRPILAAALAAALLAAAACSPGAAPPAETNAQDMRAEPAAAKGDAQPAAPAAALPTSGQIQREIVAAEPAPPPTPAGAGVSERRCGWLANPTPGNWWLFDGHGEWILGVQGGYQAPGLEDMPDMTTAGWEETNGHYGHGCACMTLTVDPATRRVTRIANAKPKPLKQCRADRGLPRP